MTGSAFQNRLKDLKENGSFDTLLTVVKEKVKEEELLDLIEKGEPITEWRNKVASEDEDDMVSALLFLADMYDRRDQYNFVIKVTATSIEQLRYRDAKIGLYLDLATNFDNDENNFRHNFLQEVVPDFQALRVREGEMVSSSVHLDGDGDEEDDDNDDDELIDRCGDVAKDRLVDVPLYQSTNDESFPQCGPGRDLALAAHRMEKEILNKTGKLRNENVALRRIRFAVTGIRYEQAAQLYRLSGNSDGENMCYFRLALMYIRGYGIDTCDNFLRGAADIQASEYLDRAATNEFGYSEAQYLLGRLKILGRGCTETNQEKSWREGFTLLQTAADFYCHFLAQYTLGIIYDEALGQNVDTNEKRLECFQKALDYYKRGKENESIPEDINPTRIKSLCEKRIELIEKIIENRLYVHPHFYIFTTLFGIEVQENLQVRVLQQSVHVFLDYYAKQNSNGKLHFENNMQHNSTKEIAAKLLEPYLPVSNENTIIQRIIVEEDDKSTGAQKNTPAARAVQRTVTNQFIKQYLNKFDCQEGERKWTDDDVTKVIDTLQDHIKACAILNTPSFEKDPLIELENRLNETFATKHNAKSIFATILSRPFVTMETEKEGKDTKYIISWPLNLIKEKWDYQLAATRLLEKTRKIWELYNQNTTERLPYKILQIYKMCKKIQEFNGKTVLFSTFEEVLECAPIVIGLIEESRQDEPQVYHHILSAKAILQRFKTKKQSSTWERVDGQWKKRTTSSSSNTNEATDPKVIIENIKADIRKEAMVSLKAITPIPGVFASIGYHKLIEVSRWESSVIDSIQESMTIGKEVRDMLHNFVDKTIVDGQPFNVSWKKSNHETSQTLNHIVSSTVEIIAEEENNVKSSWDHMPLPVPILSISRMTAEDPWFHKFQGISKHFDHYKERAKDLSSSEGGNNMEIIYETILTEDLFEKKKELRRLFPEETSFINSFPQFYSEADDPSIKARFIEKYLYFLNTACANWNDDQAISVCFLHLLNGTKGRCRDGQNSFLDRYIITTIIEQEKQSNTAPTSTSSKEFMTSSTTYSYRKPVSSTESSSSRSSSSSLSSSSFVNTKTLEIEETPRRNGIQKTLQLEIAHFIQEYKQTFVYMHGSRIKDDHESRTAAPLLLSQMLRLPFSLSGEYSQVLYPSYASENLNNGSVILSPQNVVKRFIKGGEITHQSGNTTLTTTFPKITLGFIGNLLRKHIRPSEYPLKDIPTEKDRQYGEYRNFVIDKIDGTVPLPQLNALITEELLCGNQESNDNMDVDGFFSNDVILSSAWASFKGSHYTTTNRFFQPYDVRDDPENLYCFSKCFKDACIVRLLEIAGYVNFVGGEAICDQLRMPASHVFYENLSYDWKFNY